MYRYEIHELRGATYKPKQRVKFRTRQFQNTEVAEWVGVEYKGYINMRKPYIVDAQSINKNCMGVFAGPIGEE